MKVEKIVSDAGQRLMWLITNVNGEARKLFHSCSWTDEETALNGALELLKTNYDDDDMIASHYHDKLRSGPNITELMPKPSPTCQMR